MGAVPSPEFEIIPAWVNGGGEKLHIVVYVSSNHSKEERSGCLMILASGLRRRRRSPGEDTDACLLPGGRASTHGRPFEEVMRLTDGWPWPSRAYRWMPFVVNGRILNREVI